MPKVKSREVMPDETKTFSRYDGTTGEAYFNANGRMYGPVKLSIPDYHTINAAMEMARKAGALNAATEIKQQIDSAVTVIFNRR